MTVPGQTGTHYRHYYAVRYSVLYRGPLSGLCPRTQGWKMASENPIFTARCYERGDATLGLTSVCLCLSVRKLQVPGLENGFEKLRLLGF